MCKNSRVLAILLALIFMTFLGACATNPARTAPDRPVAYVAAQNTTRLARHAPVFLIENHGAVYNRIGTPRAAIVADKEAVFVDSGTPTIYARQQTFETPRGRYTNLVYRVHFAKIPGGWAPFHIGAGKNVGLLVIVTLDSRDRPLLVTTVHTCGCYLAFVPTDYLPEVALPNGWPKGRQSVYSENLPGLLGLEGKSPDFTRTVITLRDGSHRVKDIRVVAAEVLAEVPRATAALQPMRSLEKLPLTKDTTTSFYETSGARTGYVKGSYKTRERLLMSWWALDWRVGEDKKFGRDKADGIRFYTSLKPWAREASDMRDFAAFLKYWGWRL
jgi:hypothetical protein